MTDKINEQHTFAPHDVAGMLGISAMTVRRWADYHRAHFSEVANPTPGKSRAYTWADVEKFKQIKALRDSGLSVEAINNTLSAPLPMPVISPAQSLTIVDVPDAPESPSANALIVSTIDALQRRMEALEQSRQAPPANQRDYMQGIGVGFVAALLFMLVIVGLAVLYGGFR
jgi:DNA-binding transcriptional MerR regulator